MALQTDVPDDARFSIRSATVADRDVIARHRVAMFRDMGALTPDAATLMHEATMTYLSQAMPAAEYLGWLAAPIATPDRIAAGAGVQLRRVLPFPRRAGERPAVAAGRQAIVLNVYTEPEFRRQGLARRLLRTVLAWARAASVDSLVLHAAPAGRALYQSLGFAPTNEMRFMGTLDSLGGA
jgi:GNAT superfamily N-acetyltransferase